MKRHALLVGTMMVGAVVFGANDTSALTFSQDIGVSFTFNTALNVSLSSSDLIIANLAPGTASDSNEITVNIATNNPTGYTLNATVGNNSTYNTRDLIHQSSNVTNKFTSVAYGSSIASLTNLSDNTWAFSYLDESLNNGTNTTWENYSGLPLYSDTTNITTLKTATGPASSAAGDAIKFKIAARASSDQPTGEYHNVINFTATAAPVPTTLSTAYANAGKPQLNGYYKLQDMSSSICNAADVVGEGSQMQAIDTRDNKVYWIAKLADGKCWMTQNLDFDIGSTTLTHNSTTLYHDDTDLGYGTSTNQSWTPDKATYATGTTTWDNYSTGGNNIQQSYDPGNKIWDGTPNTSGTTLDNMTQGTNTHYHIGNYYNWGAAVAMNDTSSYTTANTDVDQSICPAGWTLPKSGNNTSAGSFQYLLVQSSQFIIYPPLFYTLGGEWDGSSHDVISYGVFWSPVLYSNTNTYNLYSNANGSANPTANCAHYLGLSVRCVSR